MLDYELAESDQQGVERVDVDGRSPTHAQERAVDLGVLHHPAGEGIGERWERQGAIGDRTVHVVVPAAGGTKALVPTELAGIATNMGVESTLRQGTGLGFEFVTVEDACSTFSQEMQDFAFTAIFPRLSRVRKAQQVLEAIV